MFEGKGAQGSDMSSIYIWARIVGYRQGLGKEKGYAPM